MLDAVLRLSPGLGGQLRRDDGGTQGGEDKEALIDPADIAADKLSFEFPDALVGVPMDTELTFEITFGETLKSKGSKLVGE